MINQEKDNIIKEVTEEREQMKDRLKVLKIENDSLKKNSVIISDSLVNNDGQNLFEEIENSSENVEFVSTFECKVCGKTFLNQNALKCHKVECTQKTSLNQKVKELEQMHLEQKMHLTKQIFELKEIEIHKRYTCNSSCKTGCRIFHQKHDWVKSYSDQFTKNLETIIVNDEKSCELSEKSPEEFQIKNNHMKTIHSVQQCKQSVVELHQHIENTHGDQSKISDEHILKSPDLITIESSPNSSNVETNSKSFQFSTKHLCHVCLLSFGLEHELNQHIKKHGENVRPPSILKKLQSLSFVMET